MRRSFANGNGSSYPSGPVIPVHLRRQQEYALCAEYQASSWNLP